MRLRILSVIVLLVASLLPATAQQRSAADDRFFESLRRELIDKLQASGAFASFVSPDRATIKAKTLDGRELAISLDNLSGEIRAKPQQRNDIVERFVRMVATSAAPASEPAKPSKTDFFALLRPIVRAKGYVDHARKLAAEKPDQMLLHWPLAGDAMILIAVNGSEQIRMANGEDAKTHGVEQQELLDTALANARELLPSMQLERSPPFVALSVSEDYYSAAMLLLPEAVTKLEAELGPDFLVLLPDRNSVIAARTRDVAQLKRLAATVAQQRKAEALLPHFLQRVGGAWKPYAAR